MELGRVLLNEITQLNHDLGNQVRFLQTWKENRTKLNEIVIKAEEKAKKSKQREAELQALEQKKAELTAQAVIENYLRLGLEMVPEEGEIRQLVESSKALIEKETIEKEEFEQLIGKKQR